MTRTTAAGVAALVLVTACTESGTVVQPMGVEEPAPLVTSSGLEITNLQVESGRSYEIVDGGLEAGATRFIDRAYTVESPVPGSLDGLTFIRTANEDKDVDPGSASFLSFDVDQQVTVYVAHDDRAERPVWLSDQGFTDTGSDLNDSDDLSGAFSVFRASFGAGTVTLGSNTTSSATQVSMYTVAVEPAGGSTDTEAPTVPANLGATAASDSEIDLNWDPSSDNVGVAGYYVYRDGSQVADVTSGTSYSDTGLAASTTYDYTVAAYDAAGNVSDESGSASATTGSGGGSGTLTVTNLQVESSSEYEVAGVGLAAGTVRYTDRSYTFESPVPGELQGLTFIRTANDDKDASPGDLSFLSFDVDQDVTVFVAHDDRAPLPDWLGEDFDDTGMDLVVSDPNTEGFSVHSATFPAGTVTLGSNLSDDEYGTSMYSVIVRGEGGSGDTEAPTTPTNLTATAASTSAIDLSWDASSDNVGVAGYYVYRDGSQVADVTGGTGYSDTGLSASTEYTYTVAAYDGAGNVSPESASATATTESGSSGPLDLSNLQVESSNSYVIVEEGLDAGDTRYTDRSYVFESPVPSELQGLPFIRTANDDKDADPGDESFLSFDVNQDVTVFVAHDDRATLPDWLSQGFTDTGMDLLVSDPNTEGFSVYSASFVAGTVTLGSNVSSADYGTSMYSVIVRGEGGGSSDTEAPTVPQNLSATAVSSSQLDLTWDASSDNVGVAGYYVYRDGSQVADVTSGTSYTDTGLSASTAYSYTVAAYDAAGNVSAESNEASATTDAAEDTEAPTAPTDLGATTTSSSRIDLSWNASSDNVGVAGYYVYRDGTQAADVTSGTSYSDTGLSPSTTYSYTVAAYDAAGNVSPESNSATATTGAATQSLDVELYHWGDFEIDAPSASGNPYDVVATVEWTYEDGTTVRQGEAFYTGSGDTFAFRFGAEKEGAWTGTTSSSVSELDGLTLDVRVTPLQNSDRAGFHVYDSGNPSQWRQQRGPNESVVRIAPRLVMWDGPEKFYDDPTRLQNQVDTFAGGHGFTGAHVFSLGRRMFDLYSSSSFLGRSFTGSETDPDPRTFEALEMLIDEWLDEGGHVHIWLYTDAVRGGSLDQVPGGPGGTVARRIHRYIAARLGPVPGWSMGTGFDMLEYLTDDQFDSWLGQFPFNGDGGWHHPMMARYGPASEVKNGQYPQDGIDWNTRDSERLQVASWGQHWTKIADRDQSDSGIMADLMDNTEVGESAVPDRPHFTADRFRHRDEGRSKDFQSDDEILPVLEAYGRAGWAAIYGYYFGTYSTSSQVTTSEPWPNASDVKAANDAVDAALGSNDY